MHLLYTTDIFVKVHELHSPNYTFRRKMKYNGMSEVIIHLWDAQEWFDDCVKLRIKDIIKLGLECRGERHFF